MGAILLSTSVLALFLKLFVQTSNREFSYRARTENLCRDFFGVGKLFIYMNVFAIICA